MLINTTLRRFQTMSPPLFLDGIFSNRSLFFCSRKKFYGTPVIVSSLIQNGYSILVLHAIMSSIQYNISKVYLTVILFQEVRTVSPPSLCPPCPHCLQPQAGAQCPVSSSSSSTWRHSKMQNPLSMYRIDYILWNISLNVPSLFCSLFQKYKKVIFKKYM